MNVFQPALLRYALLVCTALLAACTDPGHNDNPSQQMTIARVGCLAATDFFAVYFNVHVQPANENQDAKITKEVFRPYCNDIPAPGRVFFTADLVDIESKLAPIEMRIVEQEFTGGNESRAENFKDLRTLAEVPATTYSKGVIESQFDLDKNGYYAVYLLKSGKDTVSKQDELRIPLNVGIDSSAKILMARIAPSLTVASALALIGVVAFRYLRKRKII